MKTMLTFWKNTGNAALRGQTVELFKVRWDFDLEEYVKDPTGQHWGMYKLNPFDAIQDENEVRRLSKRPTDLGTIEEVYPDKDEVTAQVGEDVGDLKVEHVDEDVFIEVKALEAEDLLVEPPELNLGEE
jgi:hypothetical protein